MTFSQTVENYDLYIWQMSNESCTIIIIVS